MLRVTFSLYTEHELPTRIGRGEKVHLEEPMLNRMMIDLGLPSSQASDMVRAIFLGKKNRSKPLVFT